MAATGAVRPAVRGVRVVHEIPGRLRLRLDPQVDGERAAEAVRALEGVTRCVWSPVTQSMLVEFGADASTEAVLGAVARAAGVAVTPSAEGDLASDASSLPEIRPTFGMVVSAVTGEVDRRVRAVTGDLMGLGALLPTALVIWAIREVALGRAAPLAWSTALWYAHGLFRDYNSPTPPA